MTLKATYVDETHEETAPPSPTVSRVSPDQDESTRLAMLNTTASHEASAATSQSSGKNKKTSDKPITLADEDKGKAATPHEQPRPMLLNKTEVTTSPITGEYMWTADKTLNSGGTGSRAKTGKETNPRDYGILALVSEMNLAFIHKQRKRTLFQHVYSDPNPTNNPKPMCLVVAAVALVSQWVLNKIIDFLS